jgi:hypothetical protein
MSRVTPRRRQCYLGREHGGAWRSQVWMLGAEMRAAIGVVEELIAAVSSSDLDVLVGDWLSRAAQIHLAAGNRDRATALFAEALQRYANKGATGLAAVLQQRMASLGIQPAAAE